MGMGDGVRIGVDAAGNLSSLLIQGDCTPVPVSRFVVVRQNSTDGIQVRLQRFKCLGDTGVQQAASSGAQLRIGNHADLVVAEVVTRVDMLAYQPSLDELLQLGDHHLVGTS